MMELMIESDNYQDSLEETLRKILELPLSRGLKAAKELAADALGEDRDEVLEYEDIEDEEVDEELDFESDDYDEKDVNLFGGF